jgi:hypothetical protein
MLLAAIAVNLWALKALQAWSSEPASFSTFVSFTKDLLVSGATAECDEWCPPLPAFISAICPLAGPGALSLSQFPVFHLSTTKDKNKYPFLEKHPRYKGMSKEQGNHVTKARELASLTELAVYSCWLCLLLTHCCCKALVWWWSQLVRPKRSSLELRPGHSRGSKGRPEARSAPLALVQALCLHTRLQHELCKWKIYK